MDLIEIADVEKYVSRRLSKSHQEKDDQKEYGLSPKMNKLLGKFLNEQKESQDFSSEVEDQNRIHLLSAESADKQEAQKMKSLAKNNTIMKKQMMKLGEKKTEPKMVRRNSVINFFLNEVIFVKKLLGEGSCKNRGR